MKKTKKINLFLKKHFRFFLNSSFYLMLVSFFLLVSVLMSHFYKLNISDNFVLYSSLTVAIITFFISMISEKIYSTNFSIKNLIFISPLKRIKTSFYNLMTYIFVSFASVFSAMFEIGDRPCNVYTMIAILLISIIPLMLVFYIRYHKTIGKMIKKTYSEIKSYEKRNAISDHITRDRIVYVIKKHVCKVEVAKEFINHDKEHICNNFENVLTIYVYKLLEEHQNDDLINIDATRSIYIKHY